MDPHQEKMCGKEWGSTNADPEPELKQKMTYWCEMSWDAPANLKKNEKDGASSLSVFPFSPKQFERPFVSETLPQWVP